MAGNFLKALGKSAWTYVVVVATFITVALIPKQWWWLIPSAVSLVVVLASIKVCQIYALRIAQLEEEVRGAQIRPYDAHQKSLAEQKLGSLGSDGLEFLRYLLHHGRTEVGVLAKEFKLDASKVRLVMSELNNAGLVSVERGSGTLKHFQIKPEFADVLKDLLFNSP
ncbi:MAG: hypothetical protein IH937_08245 [Acidobacteria bacterium]|nr:hypothetical protein [Acidobacteriota bacterium]